MIAQGRDQTFKFKVIVLNETKELQNDSVVNGNQSVIQSIKKTTCSM